MLNPKISIVSVCYNCVSTIERTIQSVIGQTYPNIEYIVIDGGSTDGTIDIIKKYESHIAKWISEPDKGIYDAMNKGIKMATGEWIHFRNSGDFFLFKNSLESFFEEPIKDDVSIVHGNCIYFDKQYYYQQLPPSLTTSFQNEIPVLHPATFVRTLLQKTRPFDLKYKSSADYDFFYKCCKDGIKFEYRPITIVAFEKGGFSSNWKRAYFEDCAIQEKMDRLTSRINVYVTFYDRVIRKKLKKILYALIPSIEIIREKKKITRYKPLPFNTDF